MRESWRAIKAALLHVHSIAGLVLALGLAHVLMKSGTRKASDAGRAGMLIEGWAGGLAEYSPPEVEKKLKAALPNVNVAR